MFAQIEQHSFLPNQKSEIPLVLIRGFSKALFSTWFHVPEVRSVFDAGEGINFSMGGRLSKVDAVFLSHGHTDHFTGLLNLLIARTRLAPLESSIPPVQVYFPGKAQNLVRYIDYVKQHLEANDFPPVVEFHSVSAGDEFPHPTLSRHFIRVFEVKHGPLPAVGYCVFETRDKVREAYADLEPREVGRKIGEVGKEEVLKSVDVALVCYSGDTECAIEAPCHQPKLLLHEATFLTEEDRRSTDHATLAEALEAARLMEPAEMLLFHFSARYEAEDIRGAVERQLGETPLPKTNVLYALPGRVFVGP